MRIALCLSGQPRSFRAGYEYLKRNLLDHYDVDIIWHSWQLPDDLRQEVEGLYRPAKTIYTPTFDESSFFKYDRTTHPQFPAKNTVHMLYSVFRSILLKQEYELLHGFEYDIVIKSRFDYALNRQLPFDEVLPGKLYVPNCRIKGHIPPNGLACNDQFAFGKSNVMDMYGMSFLNIDRAYNLGVPMSGEDMLSANLQINNLIRENLVYIDMNNAFPPGKYNSTSHNLIRDDFSDWNKLRG